MVSISVLVLVLGLEEEFCWLIMLLLTVAVPPVAFNTACERGQLGAYDCWDGGSKA